MLQKHTSEDWDANLEYPASSSFLKRALQKDGAGEGEMQQQNPRRREAEGESRPPKNCADWSLEKKMSLREWGYGAPWNREQSRTGGGGGGAIKQVRE